MEKAPVYYGEYLQLDKILQAQTPESSLPGYTQAHDEMLFIIIHQTYELWFKQLLFEVESVVEILGKPSINDNSNDLETVVHRLKRCVTILRLLVQQIDVIETMTPMDFLEFRDLLRPASGFQSWQFKILEAKLGLKYEKRHGQEYYISQLKPAEIDIIKAAENGKTVLELTNEWLERMPFAEDKKYWGDGHYWHLYDSAYHKSLSDAERANLEFYNKVLYGSEDYIQRNLSAKASRSALFIMLNKGFPMLELPFQYLDTLVEIDNQLSNWRHRHINMVSRVIGRRIGTGGSTGAGYLNGAMESHYIFKELSLLTSFLIERSKLPALPENLVMALGYRK